jgi:ATP-dependent helicase YprA (DUF1998 family)
VQSCFYSTRHRNHSLQTHAPTCRFVRAGGVSAPAVGGGGLQPGVHCTVHWNQSPQTLASACPFSVQAECLRQPLVEAGCNLVFTAPTSAGKSMVADVLLLQLLMAQPDKAALMVR